MNEEEKEGLKYTKNLKDKCVVCGKDIPAKWEHYKTRGNYCSSCNEKSSRGSKHNYIKNKEIFGLKH